MISGNQINGVDMISAVHHEPHDREHHRARPRRRSALGNTFNGVGVGQGAQTNIVGQTGTGRNIISGNGQHGVGIVDGEHEPNLIQNNYIGLDIGARWTAASNADGIRLETSPTPPPATSSAAPAASAT